MHPGFKPLRGGVALALFAAGCLWFLLVPGSAPASKPGALPLRPGLAVDDKVTAYVDPSDFPKALAMYAELTGRRAMSSASTPLERIDELAGGCLTQWGLLKPRAKVDTGISYHRDGRWAVGEIKEQLEALFASRGVGIVPAGGRYFRLAPLSGSGDVARSTAGAR